MWLRLVIKQPRYKTAAFNLIFSKDVKHVSEFARAVWSSYLSRLCMGSLHVDAVSP